MPFRAARACLDCGAPVHGPRCLDCHNKAQRTWHNPERKRIYASPRWKSIRKAVLMANPWCSVAGCTNPATDVDHIVPLRDGVDPYDVKNLQGLCKKHHSQKTASEVWGRKAP